jgi:hypothetical protein
MKLLAVVVLLCGCSTAPLSNISQGAHLYDAKGEIADAQFTYNGTAAGTFTITRGAERCTGEHSLLVDGIDTMSLLASLSILHASSTSTLVGQTSTTSGTPSFGVTSTANKVQRGFAVAVCPSSEVVTCQYSLNLFKTVIVGYGTCMSKGNAYQLIFV